jgi:hypothetical protein
MGADRIENDKNAIDWAPKIIDLVPEALRAGRDFTRNANRCEFHLLRLPFGDLSRRTWTSITRRARARLSASPRAMRKRRKRQCLDKDWKPAASNLVLYFRKDLATPRPGLGKHL